MKQDYDTKEASGGVQSHHKEAGSRSGRRPRGRWFKSIIILTILAVALALGRAFLPWAVRDYVNRTIEQNPLYAGEIGEVKIHLWRGAYTIHDLRISKTTGNIPVPLFTGKRVDFAIQWNALIHGKVVGRVLMEEPELNFVDAESEGESQTGAGGSWLEIVRDLFPFHINRAIVRNGSIHFRAFEGLKPVDVYLSQVQATVDNLTNIRDETQPLVSTVQATAMVMDQAKFEYKMTLDPFSYRPSFKMALRILGLDVTRLNDLAKYYGKLDFEHGWFDLVIEADAKEGQMRGYVKPLFRDLQVFSWRNDLRDENVLIAFWQALVGAATGLFKNRPRDQFGTLIPFQSDLSGSTTTDILATLGNVLRNAFVRAYLPSLEGGRQSVEGLQFSPPEIYDPISVGNATQ